MALLEKTEELKNKVCLTINGASGILWAVNLASCFQSNRDTAHKFWKENING